MRSTVTIPILLSLVLAGLSSVDAQQREDVVWVRFLEGGQSITLDGVLDEPAWDQAESYEIRYGESSGLPGSGWFVQARNDTELEHPFDPPDAVVKFLAQGDYLYVAVVANDSSIGGSPSLWNFDAVFTPIRNISAFGPSGDGFHHFPTATPEMMIGWWNSRDTTETGAPRPGIPPLLHTHLTTYGWNFGAGVDSVRTEEQMENWQAGWTINGTTNDDTNGPDEGYVFEIRYNLAPFGYELSQAGGEIVEMGLAVHDADWFWPSDPEKGATSRAWLQAQWANTFSNGSLKLHFDPSVTTSTSELPPIAPDVVVQNGSNFDAPQIDGMLDEDVWSELEPSIRIQYGEDLMDDYPGMTKYNSGYFRPNASADIPVVDPNIAEIKWFFRDDWLYVGINVDDQSIDSTRGEGGDGVRISINDRQVLTGDNTLVVREFIVTVGPDGQPRLDGYFGDLPESAYEVGLHLKGSSTVADPDNIDEGYQIEMAINLVEALGYPPGRGDGAIFLGANHFDHDIFPDAANNYSTRTWWARERGGGPPAWGYMDPDALVGVSSEFAELPGSLKLLSNYPNPFNPSTTLRYELPIAGEVSVFVYDVLGREVTRLVPGMQSAGDQQLRFEAGDLASGIYFYRVEVFGAGQKIQSVVSRMVLVK